MGVEVLHAGAKNVIIVLTGSRTHEWVGNEPLVLFDAKDLDPPAPRLRIDEIQFALQEKLGIKLWWGKDCLILPIESRGGFKFGGGGLKAPEEWDGTIRASFYNFSVPPVHQEKHYLIYLDMERLDK